MQFFIRHNIDLETVEDSETGWTALMIAASEGHVETVKALLDGGAKIDTTTPDGDTALILVAGNGNTEITKFLIARGADVKHENNEGKTALNSAEDGQQKEMTALLKKLTAAH